MATTVQFYTKLTANGLAKRKDEKNTFEELRYIEKLLKKEYKILDLGCGYGRFTIPLAKKRYDIKGIDITHSLIKKAKEKARKHDVNIEFKVGDICNLPYDNESFNVILCMWSVFMEIPKKNNQIKAIKEMLRVLVKRGWALIELPIPFDRYNKKIITKYEKENDIFTFNNKTRIVTGKLSGIEFMPSYNHNEETLKMLMNILKIKKYKIFYDKFGGRERLFLRFEK